MGGGASLSDSARPAIARRRVRLPVVRAKGGDHSSIYYFLTSVFQGPSPAEFQAALEDPFYEPCDRLLLRRAQQLAAHVHITHRTMHFGPLQIAAAGLDWLATAPQCRGRGLGTHLLEAAEQEMARNGALVGWLRTSIPHFFRRTGWALCGQASFRRANARTVLARLLDCGFVPRSRRRLHVRPWRQWEQRALARIYRQNVQSGATPYGPLERTDAYWRWLLRRKACDEVYVALEGPELLELGEISTRIVGYAAIRGEQIVELMTAPDRSRAAVELLARCCGDAIEHDRHCVLLHAPPSYPLFRIFDEADGCRQPPPGECAEVCMARLLDPLELLRRLCGEFDCRARVARVPRPLDLGMLVEGKKYQLELGREGVTATSQRIGRSYLRLNVVDFTRLLLGQLDWDAAIAGGRLECSTALAREAGRALFPALPLWRPPWDELPAP